jgi:hypothetical protein
MPRGLGFATAATSASFRPHCEQRSRGASASSVIDHPTRRARASGSISRTAPQALLRAPGNSGQALYMSSAATSEAETQERSCGKDSVGARRDRV